MKRFFWLLAAVILVQCGKQGTEPEVKYYEVKYVVVSAGDTTSIIYNDENGESQYTIFAHDERHKTWQLEFQVREGANLSIIAQSYGEPFSQYLPVVSVWCYIYVDGGAAVASGTADACLNATCGGCSYWPIIEYYTCMASASYKIL